MFCEITAVGLQLSKAGVNKHRRA